MTSWMDMLGDEDVTHGLPIKEEIKKEDAPKPTKVFHGISPKARWALVKNDIEAIRNEQQPDHHGMDFDAWLTLYTKEWHHEIEKRHPDMALLQRKMISMHSERVVSMARNAHAGHGTLLKRGQRGNEINIKAIGLVSETQRERFKTALASKDTMLVHIQGTVAVIPKDRLRFPKK